MRTIPIRSASGNVLAVEYDEDAQDLYVTFKGGRYVYHQVDGNTADELGRSDSAGKFINDVIKPQSTYERVG